MKLKYCILTLSVMLSNCYFATAQNSKTVFIEKAGTLISNFTQEEARNVVHLTLTGKVNAIDFRYLRDDFEHLQTLDISNVEISLYMGKDGTYPERFYVYPKNCIPAYAFCRVVKGDTIGKETLTKVYLSEKIKNIEDAAFKNCKNLYTCRIGKKTAPNLMKDALDDKVTAIFVPLGARDAYSKKPRWEKFAFIEGAPVSTSIQVGAAETLYENILKAHIQPGTINYLAIEGKLDVADMKVIRDYMPNLVRVDISRTSATVIPEFTFAQKKYMLGIQLPKSLLTIGERAFSGCGRLSGRLELPATLTSIAFGAFMGCDSLSEVVVTGNKLTSIGDSLFGESKGKLVY